MMTLALITTVVLAALAVMHALWVFEIWVPIRDERQLVASVVGFAEARRMPGAIPCAAVASSLTLVVALIWMPVSGVRDIGLVIAPLILASRGAMAYVPWWRRLTPQQPFARNDQRFYGPLCLVLSAALLILRGWGG